MSKKKSIKNDNSNAIQYNQVWIEEYKMMREELVNYMNKLHEVKNMMYIAVGSILLFTISDTLPIICVLLPLLFVLPIYISAVNYWLCIRKISSYLVVFHESYEDCPIHWESRNNMLKKIGIREKENFSKSTFSNISTQLYPYYTCASMTITVYFLQLYKYAIKEMKLHSSINFLMISIDGIKVYIHIIIGVVIIIFLIIFFIRMSKGTSYDELLIKFLIIKDNEEQKKIGKCWKNESYIKNEAYDRDFTNISEFINKYL